MRMCHEQLIGRSGNVILRREKQNYVHDGHWLWAFAALDNSLSLSKVQSF